MNPTNKKSPAGIPQPFNRQPGHAPQIRPLVAQLKTGVTAPQIKQPVAPPVYRPQPTPKVLQCKPASVRVFRPPLPVNQKWPSTRTIQRAATVATTPVDDKKADAAAAQALREQRRAQREAEKKARALIRLQEEKVAAQNLADKKAFYRMNAQQAHLYIQGRSASQISELKLAPKLFRTYDCAAGGVGGEYMFNPIGHGMSAVLAQTVIHVHWDAAYNREYGHFKNHIDKTKGGGSLGPIDNAKLDAMNIRAQETAERVQLLKEA
jgi:hypothetical protein